MKTNPEKNGRDTRMLNWHSQYPFRFDLNCKLHKSAPRYSSASDAIQLDGVFSMLSGPDSESFFDRRNENFTIPDIAGTADFHNGFHDLFDFSVS